MSTSLILGFFDGVHLGHISVITSALEYSEKHNTESVLVTFKESPASFFCYNFEYLMSRKESIQKIKSLGVNRVVELDFSDFAHMSREDYLSYLIKTYSPKSIFTGFNHTFGYKKSGNSEFLQLNQEKYGYKYFSVNAETYKEEVISSTRIRNLLMSGNIKIANFLLNSCFSLSGKVIHGQQLGRQLGFPTANIEYPSEIVKIPFGVYAANVDGKPAVLNWGIRPSVNGTSNPVLEVHIINHNEDLYDKEIKISIIDRIRDEIKFNSLGDLIKQINKDIDTCLKLL